MDDSARISALQIRVTELEQKLNFVLDQLKLQYAPPPASPAVAEATKWLRQGNKIEAVKVYQQLSGKGLREAKEFVDGLALQLGMS
jgi:ribosomal protein L7/L12